MRTAVIAIAIAFTLATPALATGPVWPVLVWPVLVGGDDGVDACMTLGRVAGLRADGGCSSGWVHADFVELIAG
jgi:hypothetical protein